MNKLLWMSVLYLSNAFAQESSLKIITIESQHASSSFVLEDTDQTKIDLFHYYNTAHNLTTLYLPEGIKDSHHMLRILESKSKILEKELKELEQLKKQFPTPSVSSKDSIELVANIIYLAGVATIRYIRYKDQLTKIASIPQIEKKLDHLKQLKKLLVSADCNLSQHN